MPMMQVDVASSFDNPAASAQLDVLLVRMGGELYALPSGSVREVLRYREYTPVPGAPPTLPGILNQRGLILPIVNAYPLLGLASPAIERATRLVLITHGEIDMALLVEAVLDLVSIGTDTLEPPPIGLDPTRARFLRGLTQIEGQPAALVDLSELIAGLRA